MDLWPVFGTALIFAALGGAVVVFRFVFVTVSSLFLGGGPRVKQEYCADDDMRPPTEQQLDFIERLIDERETDAKILEMPCDGLTEATKMIEALLTCFKRECDFRL